MAYFNHGCLGHYDFDHISQCARKRFIDGVSTIHLMQQAQSTKEKEEIALVCLMDVDDDVVQNLKLSCQYAQTCEMTNCRRMLKSMIENELAVHA
jgi:hypothetical protein